MQSPQALHERYIVADGDVTLQVLIGNAQIGGSVVTLDDTQVGTGSIDELSLGLGSALVGKHLSVVTTVQVIGPASRETSVRYVLSGGLKERSYELTATAEREGTRVTYLADFDLVATDGAHILDGNAAVDSATGAPKGDNDLVAFSSVSRLVRHPPVKAILNKAAESASRSARGTPVSTSFVLFAILDSGTARSDPQWAADFLTLATQRASGAAKEVRDRYLARKAAASQTGTERAPKELQATRYLLEDVARATTIARETTGHDLVATRHLLAALLVERPGVEASGAQARLTEMGLEPARLRQEMLDFVVGWGDDDTSWERWLTAPAALVPRLLPFSADTMGGEDLIGIERDVIALATLIAARQVTPPLSIGLFGAWGSGKTFFMRKLQAAVSALAKTARESAQRQCEHPFYKRIVQIEFNAWHYVEGNLWASLVEHIFANLKVGGQDDDTVTEKLQKKLLEELQFRQQSKEEATQKEQAARNEVTRAQADVRRAEAERDRKREELTRLTTKSILVQFPFTDLRERLTPVLAMLGLGSAGDAATDLSYSLHQAESVLREGGSVLGPLLHAKDRGMRWVTLGAALLLPPLVASAVVALGHWDGLSRVASLFTGLAAGLGVTARWVNKQTAWVKKHLDTVRKVQRDYDTKLKEALAENERSIADAAQQLETANAAHSAAQKRQEAASKAHEEALQELKAATSVRLLASFIQDRASSADYRKHLGLLAVVRDDFERLSGLIEDENWKLAPVVDGEAPRKKLEKFATLSAEEREIDSRINRIVLFIDDLDRCPPRKVVEVLEAVHLLLAFPLFVVVVGVDARWITRSLQSRYGELLHADGGTQDAGEELIGRATANDYLEKIFQIPFWIESMDEADCRRMVSGLLKGSIAVTSAPGDDQPLDDKTTSISDTGNDAESAQPPETTAGPPSTPNPPVPNIESLMILPDELEAMNQLASLLGRSPRALKRFVNVYRLVKAGLSAVEYQAFIRPGGGARSVLFLLAVDSGTPSVAPTVFRAALDAGRHPGRAKGGVTILRSALKAYAPNGPDASIGMAERAHLEAWLADDRAAAFVGDPGRLAYWAARVARYSFGSETAGSHTNVKASTPGGARSHISRAGNSARRAVSTNPDALGKDQ
jgi:hypothetical protein